MAEKANSVSFFFVFQLKKIGLPSDPAIMPYFSPSTSADSYVDNLNSIIYYM